MKKICTLTTQYANNQGALLQCYALQKFLDSIDDVDCHVIDYYPSGANRSWALLTKPKTFKQFVKILYTLTNFSYIVGSRKKVRKMREFIRDYLVKTPKQYNRQEILINPPIADYYICGSDQIWNFIKFDDMTYYLDFVDGVGHAAKRIAYAASLADPWKDAQGEKVSPLLKKFSALSLREKGNIPQVAKYASPNSVQWVCDPVYLLSTRDWDEVAIMPDETEPYILCYFLNIEPMAVEFVNKVRKLTGYKVINLVISSFEKFKSDKLIYAYNPREFIGYIKNAHFIITNSFHCSAFASMYHKNFRFIPKGWANERLRSLEELFGYKVIMTQQMVDEFNLEDLPVDYSKSSKMDDFIRKSKEFLLKAIDE